MKKNSLFLISTLPPTVTIYGVIKRLDTRNIKAKVSRLQQSEKADRRQTPIKLPSMPPRHIPKRRPLLYRHPRRPTF